LIVPSKLAETIQWSSAENVRPPMPPLCPRSVNRSFPVAAFHTLMPCSGPVSPDEMACCESPPMTVDPSCETATLATWTWPARPS